MPQKLWKIKVQKFGQNLYADVPYYCRPGHICNYCLHTQFKPECVIIIIIYKLDIHS